jgi:hypothetical protein
MGDEVGCNQVDWGLFFRQFRVKSGWLSVSENAVHGAKAAVLEVVWVIMPLGEERTNENWTTLTRFGCCR